MILAIVRAALVSSLAVTVALAVGCGEAEERLESQAKLSAEQEAIQRYSAALMRTEPLRAGFVQAWERSVRHEEVDTLRGALQGDVVPALARLRKGLAEVPTQTEDLARIHSVLVRAYGDLDKQIELFVAELRLDNRQLPVEKLIAQIGALAAHEDDYRELLLAYYGNHGVTVEAPAPGGATAGPPSPPARPPSE